SHQQLKEFSQSLIQQIDTMSAIASAFSDFAKMPRPKSEHLNIVEVTKLALDIFNEDFISFYSSKEDISAQFDRTQLIRIITNLVKNAIQACADQTDPQINVHVREQAGSVLINVEDNGPGISDANKNRI